MDLSLRRKLTFRSGDHRLVFLKRAVESGEHVLMKAFLWALYLPEYPDLRVEQAIGDRYKPDLVALDAAGRPRFWGEAGKVSLQKLTDLTRRFEHTRFALGRWDVRLDPWQRLVEEARHERHRGPIELIVFPPDAADRFVRPDGSLDVSFAEVQRMVL